MIKKNIISTDKKNTKLFPDKINWTIIYKDRYLSRTDENGLYVSFIGTKRHADAKVICFKFGSKLIEKLGWAPKQSIAAYLDPDDIMSLKLVRLDSISKAGHLLNKYQNASYCQLSVTWNQTVKLDRCPFKKIDYEIYKGYLLLRID